MASQEGMKWYVLRAISGQENKIKNFIEAEVKHLSMDDLLGQILIPTEKVYQIRDGKKVLKERNFFPGYIMVEATLTGELLHLIKKVNKKIKSDLIVLIYLRYFCKSFPTLNWIGFVTVGSQNRSCLRSLFQWKIAQII